MKVKREYSYYDSEKRPRSIQTAVKEVLNDVTDNAGRLEALSQEMDAVRRFLAKLTEELHKKGVLLDEDVLRLLPGYVRAEEG